MFAKFFDRVLNRILDAVVARMVQHFGTDAFAKAVAANISVPHLAEVMSDTLDSGTFANSVAECFSASDLAQHLDNEDIAQHVEIDYYDLAGRMEASEVASHLDLTDIAREMEVDVDDVTVDYEALAKSLLAQIAKAKPVEVRAASK